MQGGAMPYSALTDVDAFLPATHSEQDFVQ